MSLKIVSVKEELEIEYEAASEEAAQAELYGDHIVKDELVLGPELLQPPDVFFTLPVKCEAETAEEGSESHIKTEPLNTNTSADNVYVCDACGRSFNKKAAIINHITSHNATKNIFNINTKSKTYKYSCLNCSFRFVTISDLINHRINIHNDKLQHKACTECNYKTVRSGDFTRHLRRHSGQRFECDLCMYVTNNNHRLSIHARSHLKDNPYPCTTCGLKYRTILGLNKHRKVQHGPEKQYSGRMWSKSDQKSLLTPAIGNGILIPCEIMLLAPQAPHKTDEDAHATDNGLDRHQSPAFTEIQVKCEADTGEQESVHIKIEPLSTDTSDNSSFITDSQIMHDDINNMNSVQQDHYVCDDCGHSFNEKDAMINHIATHQLVFVDNISVKSKANFPCLMCGIQFRTTSDLINHRIDIHNEKIRHKACNHCNYKTMRSGDFTRHMERHSGRRFECNLCMYVTDNSHRLSVHAKSHLKDNPYPCDICGIKLRTILGLKKHVKKLHTQRKPYSGPMWTSNSQRMTSTVNNGDLSPCESTEHDPKHSSETADIQEDQYTCKTCNARFREKTKFVIHSMTHRTDRFKCEICEYKFKSNSDLKRHAKVHSQEKPYTCTLCNKSFSERYRLARHGKLHA